MSTETRGEKKWVVWVTMVMGGLLIINLSRGAVGLWKARDRMIEAEQRLAKLTQEKQALEEQLKYQLSDSYAEKEIREKLGMAKPGELVVILPEQKAGSEPSIVNSEKPNIPEITPDWQKWANVFGF